MKYEVIVSDKADEQLRDIVFYIADSAGSADVALKYLGKIESSIDKLADFSYIGCVPRYSVLKKQGYRVLIVEKHLVFYKVDEEKHTVIVYAVVDGRREYQRML